MADKRDTASREQADTIATLKSNLERANKMAAEEKRRADYWKKEYDQLCSSKFVKIARKYWKVKAWFVFHFAKRDSNEKTFRNWLKKIPGLRPAVLFMRRSFGRQHNASEPKSPKRKKLPVVAVIIPTYKPTEYLTACIDSVLNQTYPRKKIVIRLAVNGDNRAYYQELCLKYGKVKGFDVVYTPLKGALAGRAAAIAKTTEECVCFLDDDDLLAPNFLSALASHIKGDVNIAATGNVDFSEDPSTGTTDTYINKCLVENGEGLHEDYLSMQNLFVTFWGKVFRTKLLKDTFDPKYLTAKSSDDIIYWCTCFDKLHGKVFVSALDRDICYCRRLSKDSVTRPDAAKQFSFFGRERIEVIDILTDLFFSPCSDRCKDFILGKISSQVWIMHNYYKNLSEEEKQRYRDEVVFPAKSPLLNKSRFAVRQGIAFCQLFSPYVCASSYVSPRRLAEIEQLEKQNINWSVICWNLDNCRKRDEKYFKYYAQARFGKRIMLKGPAYFGELAQEEWALKAFEQVKDTPCDVVYSRNMWPSTHHAAYLYKKAHPEVKWYAEFGDALSSDTTGGRRPPMRIHTGEKEYLNHYWEDLENMVYELADVIIFTNENQKQYMLASRPEVSRFPDISGRSLVLHQPILDHRYCEVEQSQFCPPKGYINIGYFGSFYEHRNENDLIRLLKNEKVFLHIFTYKTIVSITEKAPEYAARVKVYPLVPYLEMLNICTRMDYLLISDMIFPGDINPFLPSKLTDYRCAQTPVLALVHGNSPLTHFDLPDLIKIGEEDDHIIRQLKPRGGQTVVS